MKKEKRRKEKSFEERVKKFLELLDEEKKEENRRKFKEWEQKILLKRTIRITI